MQKTCTIVTCFDVEYSIVQLILHSRSGRDLGYSFGDPSSEGVTLLGVCDVLTKEDLKFSVLLDKSEDCDRTVRERVPLDGMEGGRSLRRGYMLSPGVA